MWHDSPIQPVLRSFKEKLWKNDLSRLSSQFTTYVWIYLYLACLIHWLSKKEQSDKMTKVKNYKYKLQMAQDRSENRTIMIMMIIIMLLCILFLNNSQGVFIPTIYSAPPKGPVRYLCIYWKNWSPEIKYFAQGHQAIWTESRLLPSSLLNRPCCPLSSVNKQTRRGWIHGVYFLCQWPSMTLLSAESHREKYSKGQRAWGQLLKSSDEWPSRILPQCVPKQAPQPQPLHYMHPRECHHNHSSILPGSPLSPTSHIHNVPLSYLLGFLNISQILLFLPTSLSLLSHHHLFPEQLVYLLGPLRSSALHTNNPRGLL